MVNPKSLLKKASASNNRYNKKRSEAEAALKERNDFLYQAAQFSNNISDLIRVCEMCDVKSTKAIAWKKAVFLLRSSPKDFKHLIALHTCRFYPTQQDADVEMIFLAKHEYILVGLSIEQWDQFHSMSFYRNDWNNRTEKALEEIVENCQDPELLRKWQYLYKNRSWWRYWFDERCKKLAEQSRSATQE